MTLTATACSQKTATTPMRPIVAEDADCDFGRANAEHSRMDRPTNAFGYWLRQAMDSVGMPPNGRFRRCFQLRKDLGGAHYLDFPTAVGNERQHKPCFDENTRHRTLWADLFTTS